LSGNACKQKKHNTFSSRSQKDVKVFFWDSA